ncbi:TonB-dependent receptor [Marinilongibacter aquaticus]|uniref:TonB-dependent receptor plug domain-containing protein n=1 Tax=Marinilongibacter aquaticus TaxID=2975157 RepID=UPI0021BDEC2A|nr:TonB-dependent receptor [Marinilongibacter aquaticus]UBM59935.1 TonB-dependent receptor [Marinilongibacter aquaticus]
MQLSYILCAMFMAFSAAGQEFQGRVLEKKNEQAEPLIGALVRWESDPQSATFTDENGQFTIPQAAHQQKLILSLVGYKTDTLAWNANEPHDFYLVSESRDLQEVVVKGQGTVIDKLSAIQNQVITTKELAKAACCNLSESFETNASVSVSYADAITGTKQLQMLGLSGKYIQINVENMPSIRGLAIPFGMNYIPGTWIQSIDVGKGTASVVNGYESMAGAINVELLKPDMAEPFYANAYVNGLGRSELNLHFNRKINEKWSTGLLTHGSFLKSQIDRNHDGFMDLPQSDQINLLNRWKYAGKRFMGQFGVQYLRDHKEGGEINHEDLGRPNYVFSNRTERVSVFTKTALLFPETPYRGLGLINNFHHLNSQSVFGQNPYTGRENSFYSNLIYQDILGNTQHTYKAGLSFLADTYAEQFSNFGEPIDLNRNEIVPGAFVEYTYNRLDKQILVLGMRYDQHNLFGNQFTPRIHFKQDFGSSLIWRVSAGRGFRVPTPLAEYYGKLVSARQVIFDGKIKPEISWNLGTSLTQSFGKHTLVLDAYRSFFQQQLIMDMDEAEKLKFYYSNDKSYATSLQAELNLVPSDRWELKFAYRWLDVKQTMDKGDSPKVLRQKVFVPKDYALFNLAYALPYNKWKFDYTLQYRGKQRLPDANRDVYSKSFVTMNSQISRKFVRWEYYLGVENLTNFKQANPILGVDNPFGKNFDAGQTWGPVVGRITYVGLRYRLE